MRHTICGVGLFHLSCHAWLLFGHAWVSTRHTVCAVGLFDLSCQTGLFFGHAWVSMRHTVCVVGLFHLSCHAWLLFVHAWVIVRKKASSRKRLEIAGWCVFVVVFLSLCVPTCCVFQEKQHQEDLRLLRERLDHLDNLQAAQLEELTSIAHSTLIGSQVEEHLEHDSHNTTLEKHDPEKPTSSFVSS